MQFGGAGANELVEAHKYGGEPGLDILARLQQQQQHHLQQQQQQQQQPQPTYTQIGSHHSTTGLSQVGVNSGHALDTATSVSMSAAPASSEPAVQPTKSTSTPLAATLATTSVAVTSPPPATVPATSSPPPQPQPTASSPAQSTSTNTISSLLKNLQMQQQSQSKQQSPIPATLAAAVAGATSPQSPKNQTSESSPAKQTKVNDASSDTTSAPMAATKSAQPAAPSAPVSVSASETPASEVPSTSSGPEVIGHLTSTVAPWQKVAANSKRGPSLLDIQKEEEKKAAKQQQVQTQAVGNSLGSAKRYADAAGRPHTNGDAPAWSTIASLHKTPSNHSAVSDVANVYARGSPIGANSNAPTPAESVNTKRTTELSRSSSQTSTNKEAAAGKTSGRGGNGSQGLKLPSDAFLGWCRTALKSMKGIQVDEFIQMLLTFPLEPPPSTLEIIQESVYANSSSLDGRRFAHEFVKRRQVDAGVLSASDMDALKVHGSSGGGGDQGHNKAAGGNNGRQEPVSIEGSRFSGFQTVGGSKKGKKRH
ncbi:hypothetical protein BJ085DRAFT_36110 [Dimargaris cristalligena]|uniref:GYF domain-containing protein n=1 Tax=Dimargaris cristalligena TaxID=215637 RepID=A0A4P9ZQ69_9FUNG|nr:hypothetical protein BJ085DRAFT_36110 [Dimargaris cristalligena]|eukprot:RKP35614.1 hypothetical protein BJ085DRAFT_36110 [Dimargaris cristalligena]